MIFDFQSVCEDFLIVTGVEAQVVEPQQPAPKDNASDWLMDSDEAHDYADQFPDLDDPDSSGRINYWNLNVLEAVLKLIQSYISQADFVGRWRR